MTKHHLALLILILMLGSLCLCDPSQELATVFSSENAPYLQVYEEKDADAVLQIKVNLPEDEYTESFYIKRNPRSKPYCTRSFFGYGFASCGETPEGKGVGLGGTVFLEVSDSGLALVTMSFYWTSAKGNKGTLEGNIDVPWLGESKKDLGQGSQLHLSFREPKK